MARRGGLAALFSLIVLVLPATAEIRAVHHGETGAILVEGLTSSDRALLEADPQRVSLQVASLQASRGMPVTVAQEGTVLRIEPRFALRAGISYALRLGTDQTVLSTGIVLPPKEAPTPTLTEFEPSQAVIPANTLRFYLTFSEPMARGILGDAITLVRSDGKEVPSPFLNLGPELWDATQTRATLLLDPGRIKQGVGPNLSQGAPLVAGERYRLVIDPKLESAKGVALGRAVHIAFRVGPAERRPIDPEVWQVLVPQPGTRAPLSLVFDRIMDSGAAQRLIAVEGPDGKALRGTIETDGGGWSLEPVKPWAAETYRIIVDPELEDVSGNAVGQAFDAGPGTIGSHQEEVILEVRLGG